MFKDRTDLLAGFYSYMQSNWYSLLATPYR